MRGTLYLIATPLGNAQDLSPRARDILRESDWVYCEDTRTSGRLFTYLGLKVGPLRSLHVHNEAERSAEVIQRLNEGMDIAIVSDAGTPAISDPGALVVEAAHQAGIPVSPVPGPCAVSALVSAAGVPSTSYSFSGFLPKNKGARRKVLESQLSPGRMTVFFVPMRDIPVVAKEIAVFCPQALCVLGREMTKAHEELIRMEAGAFAEEMESRERLLGEATLLIWVPDSAERALSPQKIEAVETSWKRLLDGGMSRRDAREIVALLTELPKGRIKKILQDP